MLFAELKQTVSKPVIGLIVTIGGSTKVVVPLAGQLYWSKTVTVC